MSALSIDDFLIGLRIKGFGKADALAEAYGQPHGDTEALLTRMVVQGWAEGTRVGYRLTPAGRASADAILDRERTAIAPQRIAHEYERFIPINDAFKQLVTRWQLRTVDGKQIRNDHADPDYDRSVLDALYRIHDDVSALIDAIAQLLARVGIYRTRLNRALDKIKAGDLRYMTAPDRDSYHSIWFELHQDLITLCGTTRQKEAAAGRAV
jgi:pyruvate, orthophosphate dikinase